ncbi:hypothetical protein DRQ25_17255 [Candidatus Fermentibacteria bacterium]|nr:MAG: hypothetical protein DRQ25_17255 [Candidatus Fermentibacteria bacterium]
MDYSERLYRVIEQVQISLDEHSSTGDPSMVTPDKWDGILSDSGHPASGHIHAKKMPGCVGTLHGRPLSVAFRRCSEMTLAVYCSSSCLFRIVRNTLGARLNILHGMRVRFRDPEIDRGFVARVSGSSKFTDYLRGSELFSVMHGLMPFYSLTGKPGSLTLACDFVEDEINLDRVTRRMEAMVELAGGLERTLSESSSGAID